MKKRLIALALCLVMLATCLGAGMLAPTPVMLVDENGAAATSAAVPQLGRKTLTASYADATETTGYQWQFSNDGDTWIDIYGETAQTCSLSYAKVKNMLDADGEAQLRCVVTDGEDERVSSAATVTVDYSAQTAEAATEAQSGVSVMAAPARAASYTLSAEPQSDDPPAHTTYDIVINYQFENGDTVADPYTANLAAGSNFSATVTFPTVQGYLPYVGITQQNSLELDIKNINDNITYNVVYKPTNVNYTVIHYRQNLDDDNYTEAERETRQGLTNSEVPKVEKKYPGFYSLLYERPNIAADGSTVVEIYYDRYYYLMNFDLDGGYGVEPIYARYGTPIGNVGTPTKPGYGFRGWDKEIPQTMPAKNSTYTAQWSNGNSVNFTVVFWYENADDDGYSYVGSATETATVGTSVNSANYKNTSFENRDGSHFTYNSAKAETVTVAGDGSTVLNVYFTRNTYTLTFQDGLVSYACGKEEHTHTYDDSYKKGGFIGIGATTYYIGGCYPSGDAGNKTGGATKGNEICGKEEHEHTEGGWGQESCYKYDDYTITAKYQADIHSNFPIKDGNNTILWDVPNGCKSFVPGTYLASINAMPGENITFTIYDKVSAATIWYYVEALDGTSGSHSYRGKSFDLYKSVNYTRSGILTYSEEFNDIAGFKQWDSDPKFDKLEQGGETSRINENNYLYYTRNSYTLKFYNYNKFVTDNQATVQFEAPLSGYNFVPSYPTDLESNAYKFAGWYTSPGCYDGSEVNWDTATMPANDLVLYAKWVPVTHKVEFYMDKAALDAGTKLSTHPDITVPHGSKADPTPAEPKNGSYTFIGWFYMENGVEKAFDFANMPVKKDMQVYGKWSSNVLKQYTIYYKIKDTDTEIAAPTTGSGLAGVTKTFEAKGGTDLYAKYQEGYFPVTKSHSLTLDINATEENDTNVFTFWYVQKAEVPYTVKYLNKETGEPVATEKTVANNRKAVVTETFEPVSGMMPDAYQKRLVVSAEDGAVNEIIFYYTEDTTHAYYKITHYTENLGTDSQGNRTWTEYASSQAVGDIGTTYNATPMTIPGFTYDSKVADTVVDGELTADGLELKLYYTRNSYPYQVRYLEQGSGKQLAAPKDGTGKYGEVVSESAIDIANYAAVDPTSQTLNIRIEQSSTEAKLNIITFYYTENEVTINYQVVGPDGCGKVTPASETLKVLSGTAQGSTAAASSKTYRFVGWYSDAECTQPVDSSWVDKNNKLTPVKADAAWTDTTYYAKFEYNHTNLKITKSATPYDANDMFIFTVKHGDEVVAKVTLKAGESVTIKDLTVGETYTVTEDTSWSWRYSPDKVTHSIKLEPTDNEVSVTNTLDNDNWLGASSYAINQCVKNIATDVLEIVKSIFGN